jgi:hypothetical protein
MFAVRGRDGRYADEARGLVVDGDKRAMCLRRDLLACKRLQRALGIWFYYRKR